MPNAYLHLYVTSRFLLCTAVWPSSHRAGAKAKKWPTFKTQLFELQHGENFGSKMGGMRDVKSCYFWCSSMISAVIISPSAGLCSHDILVCLTCVPFLRVCLFA